ncbi:DUF423 domain-containing protein [Maricurvus nonylphenolicus]|uniref:DUF423 domain-containing protein n=1 Tax=Maricurvus nonylphenolicus TaxID=1008307 RepID=UPI0036F39492
MVKLYLSLAAASGMLAVILGAFGAHGLRDKLSAELFSAYQTGVQYHFYHTLALLAVALLLEKYPLNMWLKTSGGLLLAGILMFSGSLYLLALGGPRWLGPITPMGGLCFIVAWACLLMAVVKA